LDFPSVSNSILNPSISKPENQFNQEKKIMATFFLKTKPKFPGRKSSKSTGRRRGAVARFFPFHFIVVSLGFFVFFGNSEFSFSNLMKSGWNEFRLIMNQKNAAISRGIDAVTVHGFQLSIISALHYLSKYIFGCYLI